MHAAVTEVVMRRPDVGLRRVLASESRLAPTLISETVRGIDRHARQMETLMVIKIVPNDRGNPPGKLAEAELHFTEGELAGLKLVGFAVWDRRNGPGRNVTFPARNYVVNGERRAYALLRPFNDQPNTQDRVRDLILQAYDELQSQIAVAS
jgi:hypothetical protein